MQFFANVEDLGRMESALAPASPEAARALMVAQAWQLRQRDAR